MLLNRMARVRVNLHSETELGQRSQSNRHKVWCACRVWSEQCRSATSRVQSADAGVEELVCSGSRDTSFDCMQSSMDIQEMETSECEPRSAGSRLESECSEQLERFYHHRGLLEIKWRRAVCRLSSTALAVVVATPTLAEGWGLAP